MTIDTKPIHSTAYRTRRVLNWLPLGLTYAFLYMGRYNLTVAKNALGDLMTKEDFGLIFAAGTFTYAFAFLLNGPLTDKLGGRKAILASAVGVMVMNLFLGLFTYTFLTYQDGVLFANRTIIFSFLYACNMYFQSFGAVAIVKVNSSWFHVRERGVFGGIFGVLISLGLYFAFDWGNAIVEATKAKPENLGFVQSLIRTVFAIEGTTRDQTWWVFWIPSLILFVFTVLDYFLVFDKPSQTGYPDFDTGDASSGEMDEEFHLGTVLRKILTNKVIITIAFIEFCSGVMRNGIMHWFPIYVKELLNKQIIHEAPLIYANWGLVLMLAGVFGGIFAGFISDKIFGSRRGPVAALLYGLMSIGAFLMFFTYRNVEVLGWVVALMSMFVIGVHGMLSGTSTMDFGGRKAAGTAVGLIDGFVYLGTGVQSVSLGFLTTQNWMFWAPFLMPFALLGTYLSIKIWFAFPNAKRKGAH
ncbi:MAG: MFS transporter [bacterium]|nr:MFS transporter [bacterium]